MKVYFYAPDPNKHYFFTQDSEQLTGVPGDNFFFWIVRGYICLQKQGFPCEIVNHIPKEGIVIADPDTLRANIGTPYLGKTMLISTKGDREFIISAHINVVQNLFDVDNKNNSLWNPYYIHPWTQPGLIPRNANRGTEVKNIAYIGAKANLTKELYSDYWLNSLKELGCEWYPVFDRSKWNDYSNLDLIIAVRSFDSNPYNNKPASKLINCWCAEVPAILAPESAYLSLQKSELDCLVVNTVDELIVAVKKLKNDSQLYQAMIENGKKRAVEFTEEAITESWMKFFTEYVAIKYQEWLTMSEMQRKFLYLRRYAKLKQLRMQYRIRIKKNKYDTK